MQPHVALLLYSAHAHTSVPRWLTGLQRRQPLHISHTFVGIQVGELTCWQTRVNEWKQNSYSKYNRCMCCSTHMLHTCYTHAYSDSAQHKLFARLTDWLTDYSWAGEPMTNWPTDTMSVSCRKAAKALISYLPQHTLTQMLMHSYIYKLASLLKSYIFSSQSTNACALLRAAGNLKLHFYSERWRCGRHFPNQCGLHSCDYCWCWLLSNYCSWCYLLSSISVQKCWLVRRFGKYLQ